MCFFWGIFPQVEMNFSFFFCRISHAIFGSGLFRRPYPPAQPTLKSTTLSIVESWQFFGGDFSTSTPFFWQLFCWVLLCYAVCSQRILTTTFRKSNGKLQATTVACQFQDIRCSGLTQILISLEPFNVSKTTTAI